ncbi:hypothetical protein BaRGS_00037392 [Batillaria attramentaria]|uniref:Secreted protein n=1 Tax=Batillaria attramentaria TaxID=370345 RepID=A0ABD0J9L8_9CAEN
MGERVRLMRSRFLSPLAAAARVVIPIMESWCRGHTSIKWPSHTSNYPTRDMFADLLSGATVKQTSCVTEHWPHPRVRESTLPKVNTAGTR